jgi:polyisoprenoid-binding protein YceI
MNQSIARSSRFRPLAVWLAPLVVVVLGFQYQAAAQDDADGTADALAAGVLDADPLLLDCAGIAAGTVESDVPAPAAVYTVVVDGSAARYIAQEELASVGATEAIGETNAIVGQLLFDENGMPLACSQIAVDLRTLTSDESRRDNYLYTNTLETEQYPLATFVVTSVEGLDAALDGDEPAEFLLIGDLTVHGVTRSVAWAATATLEDGTLTGSASLTFELADFDIEEPNVPMVLSIDDTLTLEIDLVAQPA